MKKITGAQTRLERNVQTWLNEQGAGYDNGAEGAFNDLQRGGCKSGIVSHLIYYADTLKFFQTHRREISEILGRLVFDTGEQPSEMFADWDADDPLAQEEQNRNLLAWFGFEETARRLMERN